jgi:ParB-like chromosome segregation protein Spo0J
MQTEMADLIPEAPVIDIVTDDIPLDLLDVAEGTEKPTKAMIDTMKTVGLISPITVERYHAGNGDGTRFRVVEGRRRVLAARDLGWTFISAAVVGEGDYNRHVAALVGNLIRSRNPMDEYNHVRTLIDAGFSEEEIAKAVHVTVKQVQKIRRTGDRLTPTMKAAIEDGSMPFSAAAELVSLPKSVQDRVEERLAHGEKVTLKDVREEKHVKSLDAMTELPAGLFAPESNGSGPSPEMKLDRIHQALVAAYQAVIDGSDAYDGTTLANALQQGLEEIEAIQASA